MSFTFLKTQGNCTTDSFNNTCAQNCCTTYSGGIMDNSTTCSPWTICESLTEVIVTPSECIYDQSGNKRYEKCCATVATTVNTTRYGVISSQTISINNCYPKMFCQGINPQAMSPSNMVKFSDQISKALEPMPTLTGGAIGGIVFLSVTAAVLIALVLFFGIKIWKTQNSIEAPKEPQNRQNEEPAKLL